MSAEHEIKDILYRYSCRTAKPREVHAVAAKHGWSVNLRSWIGNKCEAVDSTGHYVWLAI